MGLQANGTTNYSDALNTDVGILKNENAGGSGALTGAQTAGYFLSDGAPNTDTISGSTNYGFGTTAGDTNPSSGLSTLEQKTWNSVLASTGVKEYALGYGAANATILSEVGYNGATHQPIPAVVNSFSNLPGSLAVTVLATPVHGNLVATGSKWGADGAGMFSRSPLTM